LLDASQGKPCVRGNEPESSLDLAASQRIE